MGDVEFLDIVDLVSLSVTGLVAAALLVVIVSLLAIDQAHPLPPMPSSYHLMIEIVDI